MSKKIIKLCFLIVFFISSKQTFANIKISTVFDEPHFINKDPKTIEEQLLTPFIDTFIKTLGEDFDSIISFITAGVNTSTYFNAWVAILNDTSIKLNEEQKQVILNHIRSPDIRLSNIIQNVKKEISEKKDKELKFYLIYNMIASGTAEGKIILSKEIIVNYCNKQIEFKTKTQIKHSCNVINLNYKKGNFMPLKTVEMQLVVTEEESGKVKIYPKTNTWKTIDYTKSWNINFDSIPKGQYLAKLKLKDSIYTYKFSLTKDCESGYCCSICKRDLALNTKKLEAIFKGSKSNKLNSNTASIFTKALQVGGFNTCKQHTHFFSQIIVESQNFQDFEENYWYRLVTIYKVFGGQTQNNTVNIIHNQKFWDNEEYIKYIASNMCNHRYVKNNSNILLPRFKASKSKIKKTKKKRTISFPQYFTLSNDADANYILKPVNPAANGKNLFNMVYKNKNGNFEEDDGWNYRGRGVLQVTGRSNYREAALKANAIYGTNFNWEQNPDQLAKDSQSIVFSATSWFLNNFKPITILDNKTPSEVTKRVNAKKEALQKRVNAYKRLINDINLYYCD